MMGPRTSSGNASASPTRLTATPEWVSEYTQINNTVRSDQVAVVFRNWPADRRRKPRSRKSLIAPILIGLVADNRCALNRGPESRGHLLPCAVESLPPHVLINRAQWTANN